MKKHILLIMCISKICLAGKVDPKCLPRPALRTMLNNLAPKDIYHLMAASKYIKEFIEYDQGYIFYEEQGLILDEAVKKRKSILCSCIRIGLPLASIRYLIENGANLTEAEGIVCIRNVFNTLKFDWGFKSCREYRTPLQVLKQSNDYSYEDKCEIKQLIDKKLNPRPVKRRKLGSTMFEKQLEQLEKEEERNHSV